MIAILSLWIFKEKKISFTTYWISVGLFFVAKVISIIALVYILVLWGCCHIYHQNKKWSFIVSRGGIFFLGVGLFLHIFPGIYNVNIVHKVMISKAHVPYSFYLNFKGSVGFFLLAYLLPLARNVKDWKRVLYYASIFSSITIVTLLGLAVIPGWIQLDPKWPSFAIIWMLSNLLFTSVSEEAFFRGFILQNLSKAFHFKGKRILGLLLSSILFGLFHFRQGPLFIILSTIAGLFYGSSFLVSKRIEVSIFTHFLLNATHFLFFTYPM